VDTEKFLPKQRDLPYEIPNTNFTLTENQVLVSYVGRVIWTKGVENLFDVGAQIFKNRPDIVLIFCGGGELEHKLREKCLKAGLQSRVLFTGPVSYEEVKNILGHSEILVNPSHHNEGLPSVLLEAGSCECCVIATDNGATSELIEHQKTGYLIKPKDKSSLKNTLIDALDNKEKRRKFGKELREKIEKEYTWKQSSTKLYDLLTSNLE
jgi:glycosyltransferase involved in cell wall biosynthesis